MSSPYIHGSSAEEQARLGWMNALLNARELEVIKPRGDERALEMGAGTGIFARALAEKLPRGSVLAVERDARSVRADMIFFGACAGMAEFSHAADNLIGVLAGAAEEIAAAGDIAKGDINSALDGLRTWQRQPGAALWYALPVAIGTAG